MDLLLGISIGFIFGGLIVGFFWNESIKDEND